MARGSQQTDVSVLLKIVYARVTEVMQNYTFW